jgi:tetratricopeptide (TPR) repeat protein
MTDMSSEAHPVKSQSRDKTFMETIPGESGDDAHRWWIVPFVLAAFAFIVYRWVFAYTLMMSQNTPGCFFMFGRDFLAEFLGSPGGLVSYTTNFVRQFNHYPWVGALIIAIIVPCLYIFLVLILERLRGGPATFVAFFPCVLLLTTLNYSIIHVTLGLIPNAAAFLGLLHLRMRGPKLIYAAIAIPGLYLLTGAYFWLFAAWVIMSPRIDDRSDRFPALRFFCLALAIATPFIAWRWLFLVPLRHALLSPTILMMGFSAEETVPTLVLSVSLLLLPSLGRMLQRRKDWLLNHHPAVQAALLGGVALILLYLYYNSSERSCVEYEQLYARRQWDMILEKAKSDPPCALLPQFIVNCALQHKGRLLEEMFRYPQNHGARSLILSIPRPNDPHDDLLKAMYNSDLFFEMGHMNMAFAQAFNAMVTNGRTYASLQRMAECSMVLGNYDLAKKYLSILEQTFFYRTYARHWKSILANATAKEASTLFPEQQSRLPKLDLSMLPVGFMPPLTLLKSDAHNRMAFDYFAAWCLLDRVSLPMLVDNIGCLKDAGYARVPDCLEEALLIVKADQRIFASLQDLGHAEATRKRFDAFEKAISMRDGGQAAMAFNGTYLYYFTFSTQPPCPILHQAHAQIGNELFAIGRTDEAVAHYRYALALVPDFSAVHAALATALRSQGKLGEAKSHDEEARRTATIRESSREEAVPSIIGRSAGRTSE